MNSSTLQKSQIQLAATVPDKHIAILVYIRHKLKELVEPALQLYRIALILVLIQQNPLLLDQTPKNTERDRQSVLAVLRQE